MYTLWKIKTDIYMRVQRRKSGQGKGPSGEPDQPSFLVRGFSDRTATVSGLRYVL